jgi:hypothetical protein
LTNFSPTPPNSQLVLAGTFVLREFAFVRLGCTLLPTGADS